MKACVLHETGSISDHPLQYEDADQPSPDDGQVLIRIRACGVCRTDLHVVEGELDRSKQPMPLIPGHQIVGEIAEIGGRAPARPRARPSPADDETPKQGTTRIADDFSVGDRVGVAWLHCTCGRCRYCTRGDENLCDSAGFTGYTRNGGYAEYVVAEPDFLYRLPESMDDLDVAPLLCAGIIGYRCLRQCIVDGRGRAPIMRDGRRPDWSGFKLGIYGFGAAGHLCIQVARGRGADVYVCTRDERHQALARELGAAWVGGAADPPPEKLDASIIFAPAGELVPPALEGLDRGGVLVCGGIHMSPIPEIQYQNLYWERVIRSVANNTREDGEAFLREAAETGVQTSIQTFPLKDANEALDKLKNDAIRGAAVLVVESG